MAQYGRPRLRLAPLPAVCHRFQEEERARALIAMGFDAREALVLAATRLNGAYVDVGHVQRLLDHGCRHQLALRICF
jgi:hypothetical protein